MDRGLRFALVSILLFLPASRAAAECTMPDTPCREYARHELVFQGRVDSITPLGRPGAYAPNRVSFVLERAWKGVSGTTVEVFEADAFDSDHHGYVAGERYVVYGYRDRQGRIRASSCGRTKRVAEAKWDLEFLDGLSRPATGGRVFGSVVLQRGEQPGAGLSPLPEVLVVLERGAFRREARSGPAGDFEFDRLDPGTYSVSIVVPAGYAPLSAQPFTGPVTNHRPPAASVVHVDIEGDRDCTYAVFVLR